MCLRQLAPELSSLCPPCSFDGEEEESGDVDKERSPHESRTYSVSTEQIFQVHQLAVHHSNHAQHNVVTASLELLRALLDHAPPALITALVSPDGIRRSYIEPLDSGRTSSIVSRTPSCGSISGILGSEDDVGLDTSSGTILMKTDSLDEGVEGSLQEMSQVKNRSRQTQGSNHAAESSSTGEQATKKAVDEFIADKGGGGRALPFETTQNVRDLPAQLLPDTGDEALYSSIEIGKISGTKQQCLPPSLIGKISGTKQHCLPPSLICIK